MMQTNTNSISKLVQQALPYVLVNKGILELPLIFTTQLSVGRPPGTLCMNMRMIQSFYARQQNASRVSRVLAIVEFFVVRLFVCPSHCSIVSKQRKLGSQNLHCGLP